MVIMLEKLKCGSVIEKWGQLWKLSEKIETPFGDVPIIKNVKTGEKVKIFSSLFTYKLIVKK
jgi:hypothetical protein